MASRPCEGCSRVKLLRPKEQFVCEECRWWPLCGPCILNLHLDHGRCYNVVRNFRKHIIAFGHWWHHCSKSQLKVVSKLDKRITASLAEFKDLAPRSPCSRDEIFKAVIWNNYFKEVEQYSQPYKEGMATYWRFRNIVELMHRFNSVQQPLPENAPVEDLVFYELGTEKLDKLVETFNELAAEERKSKVDAAVKKLENLNLLLKSCPTLLPAGGLEEAEAARGKYEAI